MPLVCQPEQIVCCFVASVHWANISDIYTRVKTTARRVTMLTASVASGTKP